MGISIEFNDLFFTYRGFLAPDKLPRNMHDIALHIRNELACIALSWRRYMANDGHIVGMERISLIEQSENTVYSIIVFIAMSIRNLTPNLVKDDRMTIFDYGVPERHCRLEIGNTRFLLTGRIGENESERRESLKDILEHRAEEFRAMNTAAEAVAVEGAAGLESVVQRGLEILHGLALLVYRLTNIIIDD